MKCRGASCKTEVLFALDNHGKRQILDTVAPVYRLVRRDPDGTAHVTRADGFYVTHFATCRDAGQFTKAAPPKKPKGEMTVVSEKLGPEITSDFLDADEKS
jgi:hypothetical protein